MRVVSELGSRRHGAFSGSRGVSQLHGHDVGLRFKTGGSSGLFRGSPGPRGGKAASKCVSGVCWISRCLAVFVRGSGEGGFRLPGESTSGFNNT